MTVFDEPSAWRLAAARRLGLTGEELSAGLATGVAYPLALRPVADALELRAGDRVLDIGSGLGGAAAWLAGRTRATVVALEPERAAAAGAAAAFADLAVVRGGSDQLPFAPSSFDAVTLFGVVSLVADLAPLGREIRRVIRPGGRIGVSDLVHAEADEVRTDGLPNTFRSLRRLVALLEGAGCRITELAAGAADVDAGWGEISARVDDEIRRRHGREAGFAPWAEDRRRLRDAIEAGELHVASIVATVPR